MANITGGKMMGTGVQVGAKAPMVTRASLRKVDGRDTHMSRVAAAGAQATLFVPGQHGQWLKHNQWNVVRDGGFVKAPCARLGEASVWRDDRMREVFDPYLPVGDYLVGHEVRIPMYMGARMCLTQGTMLGSDDGWQHYLLESASMVLRVPNRGPAGYGAQMHPVYWRAQEPVTVDDFVARFGGTVINCQNQRTECKEAEPLFARPNHWTFLVDWNDFTAVIAGRGAPNPMTWFLDTTITSNDGRRFDFPLWRVRAFAKTAA